MRGYVGVRAVRWFHRTARLAALGLLVSMSLATPSGAHSIANATLLAFNAPSLGSPGPSAPAVVGATGGANGVGYYVLRANGTVDSFGTPSYGSMTQIPAGSTATGIALDTTTGGYWVVSSNGTVEGFNAPFLGEPHIRRGGWGQYPAAVAIAAAPGGAGYYVLRANGSVGAYGVKGHGSLGGHLVYGATAPVVAVAIAVDPATGGYWIATSTGAIASFDAPSYSSPLTSGATYDGVAVTALAATPSGSGYDVLRANGSVDSFGATFYGSPASQTTMPVGGLATSIALDPTTGGYYVGIDDTPLDGYVNPLRAVTSLLPQEVDQGVDYCGSGPIYALGNGTVVNVYDDQWPSGVFISYRLSSGPAKGLYVYVAENVTPAVSVGEPVTPETVVGVVHDARTCVETGWADPPSHPERAAAHGEYNGVNSTAYGLNFNSLLEALGSRPGLPQPDGPPGPIPADWPTWS
ncbi:MAG: hypothetical protein WCA31_12525 [Acidimicrobiales bacterium]